MGAHRGVEDRWRKRCKFLLARRRRIKSYKMERLTIEVFEEKMEHRIEEFKFVFMKNPKKSIKTNKVGENRFEWFVVTDKKTSKIIMCIAIEFEVLSYEENWLRPLFHLSVAKDMQKMAIKEFYDVVMDLLEAYNVTRFTIDKETISEYGKKFKNLAEKTHDEYKVNSFKYLSDKFEIKTRGVR